jgi:hypothetical protein
MKSNIGESISIGVTKLRENPARFLTFIKNPKKSIKAVQQESVLSQFTNEGLELNHAFGDSIYKEFRPQISERSFDLLEKYLNGERRELDELLNDRTYVFVIGSPRTGGSYTNSKLRKVLCSYQDHDPVVQNESIPTFDHLALSDIPEHRNQAIYELIQWLVWIDIQYDGHDVIVKKCSGFPFDMGLVEDFFGDCNTKYVVTTRHPASVYRSNADLENSVIPDGDDSYLFYQDPPNWWNDASDMLRSLYYWHDLYYELVESANSTTEIDLEVIRYGNQEKAIKQVVDDVRPELISDVERLLKKDSFRLTERDFQSFWFSSITRSIIKDVQSRWEQEGLSFPVEHDNIEKVT